MRLIKTVLAAAVAATALTGAAFAGGFAPAVGQPQPTVIVEPQARRSTWGLILPLLLLGAVVAAAAGGDEGSSTDTVPTGGSSS